MDGFSSLILIKRCSVWWYGVRINSTDDYGHPKWIGEIKIKIIQSIRRFR